MRSSRPAPQRLAPGPRPHPRAIGCALTCHKSGPRPNLSQVRSATWPTGLPRLWLTRGLGGSGRECGPVDCLVFDGCEPSESPLPPAAMVGPLDPGDDGQAQLLPVWPALAVLYVLLQHFEERLHRGVIP